TPKPETYGTIRGEVRNDQGELLTGGKVSLSDVEGDLTSPVDSAGRFAFAGVSTGPVRLYVEETASEESLPTARYRGCAEEETPWNGAYCLQLDPGQEEFVTLTVLRAARVTGRVVDQGSVPVENATVYHDNPDPNTWRETGLQQTDSEGKFTFWLYPGEIQLRTSLSRFSDWTYLGIPPEFEFAVSPGEHLELGDIVLGGGNASLVGRVTDANGDSAAMIKVVLSRIGGIGSMSTETDAQGNFRFLGVYPGEYQFAVAPDGAILGNPRRFLHVPGPVRDVVVTGEVGDIDLGDFELRFDGSFHLYARLSFADGHLPAWEDLRARVFLPSGIELKDEELEFQSKTQFEWHVREPDLLSEVVIEVSELDPETKEALWTKTVNCVPKRHQRQRVFITVE
ncbi:MAG: carboxypeptidase-like regulatory domain-containing protein, partial [Planctomycetota bacterium]